jgi:tRNA A-37 threonylcarbamoyl transferase component Bud32/tetratricopeptide (TPR) repeat protein
MGAVYEAEDTRLRRRVAVKFLPETALQNHMAVERFKREAQAASALNHPNIVTIHDIVESGELRCIVMEAIEGRTLRKWLEDEPSLERSIGVIMQVSEALSVAHGAGIVHRDLKPENIMVREDGYAKILDFGLARLRSDPDSEAETVNATTPGAIVGTVPYMSPEQCSGNPIQVASDLFSLGVVLYEIAAGRHPFRAESTLACVNRILTTTPLSPSKLNPAVSADLESVIFGMLEKEPRLRPSAAEVTTRLRRIREGRGTADPVLARSLGTIVGRAEPEETMSEVLASAVAGHGRLLCVTGEPGMGKTTLVEDFLLKLAADETPYLIARGRCSERLAGTEAYLPVLEALEKLLRNGHGSRVAESLKLLAPTWYFRIAPLSSEDSSGSRLLEDARAASQERMKRELLSFLEDLSRRIPVVLFFDDVHWADASTVDFLAYMGLRGDGLRVLTIATYRPSDLLLADHPFVGLKRELQSRGVCSEIALSLLGREDIARYLDLEFAGHAFGEDLADFVHARTEGNPLFLVNILRYLRDLGAFERRDRWQLVKSLSEIEKEVPASVRSMIERKLDQLEDADRRLLIAASVQGVEFQAAVVAEAMEADEADVEESLDKLDQVHAFVRRLGEEEMPDGSLTLRYGFVHALYQNALYETLTPARRTKLSAAVASALSTRHGQDLSAVSGELGILYESARDFARASDCFLQAARKAIRVYANHEAVELCDRSIANARKLRGKDGESRVLTATLELAYLQITLSRFDQAARYFERAERAAEVSELTEKRIQAICGRGTSLYNLKRLEEMRAEGERAMVLAQAANSVAGVASAELVLATHGLCLGELDVAENLFARAIPVLQAEGLHTQALEGVVYSGALHMWRQEYEDVHRILGVAINKARELGSGYAIVGAYLFQGIALGNEGRLGDALESLTEARRLAELNQERYWLPRLPNTVAWLYRELGDPEKSHLLNLENVELAQEFGMQEGEANAHVNLAGDYLNLGELARAHEHLRKAEAIFEQDVWYRWRYNIRLKSEYARYWIARGDLASARTSAEAGKKAAGAHGDRKYAAWARAHLAEIAFLEDDVDTARIRLDEAIGILAERPCPTIAWKVFAKRADLASKIGETAAADEYRGRARDMVKSLADSVPDGELRTRFLKSRAVRRL